VRAPRASHWSISLAQLALLGMLGMAPGLAKTPPEAVPLRADVQAFVSHMVQTHGFDGAELQALFSSMQPSKGVQRAVSAPSTARPWHEFRPLFVDAGRFANGPPFWDANAQLLARAHTEFGVPESVIVSIIGIETRYGKVTGGFRVLDSLYTLAFEVPARADYFRGELEQFLLLAREQGWDAAGVSGSYAGAMGMPQFMPSSYRRYAVDYNGDGRIDLWRDAADVIGSVASYLKQFGWRDGEPVVEPVRLDTADWPALLELGLKPSLTVDQWRMRGVEPINPIEPSLMASLFRLDLASGPEFWLGFDNFYTILMYNRSRNYAMAVHELSREIARERERLANLNTPAP
jgi:membrane-bound lytic murein transglycosylase B